MADLKQLTLPPPPNKKGILLPPPPSPAYSVAGWVVAIFLGGQKKKKVTTWAWMGFLFPTLGLCHILKDIMRGRLATEREDFCICISLNAALFGLPEPKRVMQSLVSICHTFFFFFWGGALFQNFWGHLYSPVPPGSPPLQCSAAHPTELEFQQWHNLWLLY